MANLKSNHQQTVPSMAGANAQNTRVVQVPCNPDSLFQIQRTDHCPPPLPILLLCGLIQLLLHLAHHLSRRDKRYPRHLCGQVGSRRDNVLLPHVADALADLANDLVEEGKGL